MVSPATSFLVGSVFGYLFGKYWSKSNSTENGLRKLDQNLSDQLIDCLYNVRKDSRIRDANPGETYDEFTLDIVRDSWRMIKFEYPEDESAAAVLVGRLFLVSDVGAIHLLRVEDRIRKNSLMSVQGIEGQLKAADVIDLIKRLKSVRGTLISPDI